ncbi:MAG: 50S ribosomal protein L32 [Desulfobacteraceae bacterium]|nr:50S ribosomal protein L32 [Desulfobacteraceae bacterium]
MAVPKKKKSKSRRDMRRSHDNVKLPNATTCPHCHELVLPHHVCTECGTYKGRTILKTGESK